MEWLHNTKLWLIIIAIGHTALGAGGSYANHGNDALAVIGFFVVGLYLFYAAPMTEGQTQKRLAVVLCGPVVVWFLLVCRGWTGDVRRASRTPCPGR